MQNDTAATRTRIVKRALIDAGYSARVTSAPASHQAQQTIVDQCEQLADVAAYLTGYLQDIARVTTAAENFVCISWRRT